MKVDPIQSAIVIFFILAGLGIFWYMIAKIIIALMRNRRRLM